MRAEKGGADRDRPHPAKAAGCGELPHLGLGIETIAGLDLDCGRALADQRVEPRQRGCDEFGLARLARRGHG